MEKEFFLNSVGFKLS